MSIGSSRHLVTVQRRSSGRDPIGQPVQTWTDVTSVYADIRYLRGLEAIKAGAQTGSAQVSIRLRTYRTDLTSGMRVTHEGKTYEIVGQPLPDMLGRRYVDLVCTVTG